MEKIQDYFPSAQISPVVVDGFTKMVVYSDNSSFALILGMGEDQTGAIANALHTISVMLAVGSI